MNTDLSMQMLAMSTAKTQHSVQIAVFKKAHEMQLDLINTLMDTPRPVPPAGQGLQVDKHA